MKGILAVKGRSERFVFQGVHMLMDGRPDRPWGARSARAGSSSSAAISTGKALNEGFASCLA